MSIKPLCKKNKWYRVATPSTEESSRRVRGAADETGKGYLLP